jgi:hypothetical protein
MKFHISEVERLAFELASLDQKISFLEAVFEGKNYNIVSMFKDSLIHVSSNISTLFSSFRYEFQPLLSSLIYNKTYSNGEFNFFYKPIEKYINHKKSLNFTFNIPYSKKEIEFLERTYHRVFQYSPAIQNSKNLAYRVIKFEKRS